MTSKRPRRQFTDDFKHQMVELYRNGKSRTSICREYELTASSLNRWITQQEHRKFSNRNRLEVVVSDLTYVRVAGKWNYVCLIVDLFNREIIGHSSEAHKGAKLV